MYPSVSNKVVNFSLIIRKCLQHKVLRKSQSILKWPKILNGVDFLKDDFLSWSENSGTRNSATYHKISSALASVDPYTTGCYIASFPLTIGLTWEF